MGFGTLVGLLSIALVNRDFESRGPLPKDDLPRRVATPFLSRARLLAFLKPVLEFNPPG